uniref:DNA-directed RNA polymerase III subunit RPC4 n=1 Tax=Elaeophora elaphi TaxID=1147741 RepID=A0A0R3RG51_9BILA
MSVGGRGSSSRGSTLRRGHVPLPNLSIAGKRETKCESTGTKGTRRAGKRERGGRGRCGRDQGREKPNFIEQQGIFSSGLNDEGRHNRMKNSISDELRATNLGRIKKDPEDLKKERNTNSTTYESEWLSDEEADNKELEALLRDGFLSDLKPGKVIPLVLPETEQEQFQHFIKKEKNLENGYESMDTNSLPPTKRKRTDGQHLKTECEFEDIKKPQLKELETVNTMLNPTATSSRRAATIMQNIQKDENGPVLMLQLPSTLSAVKNSAGQEDTIDGPKPEENTCPTIKHCLDDFANGSKIGKLRIRKGGRMELSLCGMPLDVTCGVATRYNESVLLIDPESQTTTSTIKAECGDEQSPCRGYILGTIVDSFICSHNLPEALDAKREEQKRDKRKFYETKTQQDESEDLEMKDLLLELSSIEKKEESWSKWTLEYSDSSIYDDS